MRKYFLSMNKILKYNDIGGNDYSDSIELYSSKEECMKYACQNLKAYASGIQEMQFLNEYLTDKMLAKPTINLKLKDKNVICEIIKTADELKMEVSQKLLVSGQPLHISLIYQFIINGVEEENVAYAVATKFDSEVSSYIDIIDTTIYDSMKEVLDAIDKFQSVRLNNACDFIICVVDKKKAEKHGLKKYEKMKRKLDTTH